MSKVIDARKAGKIGGEKTKATYGSDHFRKAGEKGRETIRRTDPDFYKRLAAAGLHAREVKQQAFIQAQLVVKEAPKSAFHSLADLLRGKSFKNAS